MYSRTLKENELPQVAFWIGLQTERLFRIISCEKSYSEGELSFENNQLALVYLKLLFLLRFQSVRSFNGFQVESLRRTR